MSTPAQHAIARLMTVYGDPKVPDPDAYLEEVERALKGTDAALLDRAIDGIVRTATYWPRPAEILAETRRISAEVYGKSVEAPVAPRVEPTAESKARVSALVADAKRSLTRAAPPPVAVPELDWQRGQHPGCVQLQAESPNVGLHRTRDAVLSTMSKRMAGDRD